MRGASTPATTRPGSETTDLTVGTPVRCHREHCTAIAGGATRPERAGWPPSTARCSPTAPPTPPRRRRGRTHTPSPAGAARCPRRSSRRSRTTASRSPAGRGTGSGISMSGSTKASVSTASDSRISSTSAAIAPQPPPRPPTQAYKLAGGRAPPAPPWHRSASRRGRRRHAHRGCRRSTGRSQQ